MNKCKKEAEEMTVISAAISEETRVPVKECEKKADNSRNEKIPIERKLREGKHRSDTCKYVKIARENIRKVSKKQKCKNNGEIFGKVE